jgi:hypothetical protein
MTFHTSYSNKIFWKKTSFCKNIFLNDKKVPVPVPVPEICWINFGNTYCGQKENYCCTGTNFPCESTFKKSQICALSFSIERKKRFVSTVVENIRTLPFGEPPASSS